ncbi:uncharacterized protein BJ212DRAFT_1356152 [Suillus subaureus]|uniref:Smr domain-containing protein n=1 Tax=Suillus subaureus TaxID=48587 RepID=A0A9P7EAE9_9AGAM|nr:uncharacterized protein BJ212DRAFT_1356152 [Suillus subaureus]KAG1816052.1 hypothetical protein BJ212DRAFT_1356152 [Suillus subaureus]
MQMFISSVLSALETLLKGLAWLLREVIFIIFGRGESPPPPPHPSTKYPSAQGSIYHLYPPPPPHPSTKYSQSPSAHQSSSQQQGSTYHLYPPPPPHPSTKYSQSPSAHQSPLQQQGSTYRLYPPPPSHPAIRYSQYFSAHLPQYIPYRPYRQQSVQFPAQLTPPVSPDVAPVTEPLRSYIPQDTPFQPYRQQSIQFPAQPTLPVSLDVTAVTEPIRSDTPQACLLTSSKYSQPPSAHRSPSQYTPFQPYCQQSVQFPAQLSPPVSPDVALVIEPVQSDTPQQSRRFSGPELVTRAPEVVVTPIVIDPYEDPGSLRLKARSEGSRMEECFKQSREAFARNERALAKQLSLRGEAYKANMVRLDKEASTKIFQEHNQRHRSNTIDLHGLFVSEAKVYFDDAVQEVRDRGESLLRVIVGRGNHSENNIARIKPAIQEYGQSLGLGIEVDPLNNGCLVVSLDPS